MNGFDLQITVRKHKDGTITTSIVPTVKDKEKSPAPMAFTGTPEELDAELFAAIKEPLEKHAGMIANTKAFEKSTTDTAKAAEKTAPKNSNAAPAKKAEPAKPVKTPVQLAIEAGDAAMKKRDWETAVTEYDKALKLEATNKEFKKKLLEAKTNRMKQQEGLFDDDELAAATIPETKPAEHKPGAITPNPKAEAAPAAEVEEFGEDEDPADETLAADPTNEDDVENF